MGRIGSRSLFKLQAVDFGVLVEDGTGYLEQLLSLLREDEGFVVADEECAAQFLLKLRYMVGNCGLADAERSGGFAEVEAFGGFAEGFETFICHNRPKVSDLFGN